jgi:hypothetical protein
MADRANNALEPGSDVPAFAEPLVEFAISEDDLFTFLKADIGPGFYWTPEEAFSLSFPAETEYRVNFRPEGRQLLSKFSIHIFILLALLAEKFTPDSDVNMIIPALPLNLPADWIKKKLSDENRLVRSEDISDQQLHQFPHPIRLGLSRVVMSHADFLCPQNCFEPDDNCTYTRRQRPLSLYRLLETTDLGGFVPLILRSRQFAAGGYFPEDLWNLADCARLIPGTPLLIGTACKCHGIVDSLSRTKI